MTGLDDDSVLLPASEMQRGDVLLWRGERWPIERAEWHKAQIGAPYMAIRAYDAHGEVREFTLPDDQPVVLDRTATNASSTPEEP